MLNIRLKFLLSFIKWSGESFLLILVMSVTTLVKKRKNMKYSVMFLVVVWWAVKGILKFIGNHYIIFDASRDLFLVHRFWRWFFRLLYLLPGVQRAKLLLSSCLLQQILFFFLCMLLDGFKNKHNFSFS